MENQQPEKKPDVVWLPVHRALIEDLIERPHVRPEDVLTWLICAELKRQCRRQRKAKDRLALHLHQWQNCWCYEAGPWVRRIPLPRSEWTK